ncbi:unnamed protein product [Sphenostylis stenocarpa]|uniref:Transmembrane protein n=1 Tax=Sphenostylis stenocarpa TaxID=92480 RepID=A0AA87BBG3_9FABA|nr:unnamed protein product [Sphenostylis stenocarpa]
MKVLNFLLAFILLVAVVHVEPNLAGRVLNMNEPLNLMSLDNKGPVTPSGPSTCTYIPRTGGKNCPPLEEMNVAGNFQHHGGETYPRLVLNFILILILAVVHVEPNLAGRVLNMKQQLNLVSLEKGPVPPSGPSTCTYIPGTGGKNCPPLEEMNVGGHVQPSSAETYPRLVVPFGLATNQH